MRRLVSILIVMMLVGGAVNAQQVSADKNKKELRKERKELRKRQLQISQDSIRQAIEEYDFTLRANTVKSRRGQTLPVDNLINFVQIEGDEIAVQFGDILAVGHNGVGGITYQGKIQDLKFIENEDGKGFSVNVIFNSPGTIHAASVRLDVNGENVKAQFTDGPRRATLIGSFERASESLVFVSPNRSDRVLFW